MTAWRYFFPWPWIKRERLREWVQALWYPAVLGTVIMAWLAPSHDACCEMGARVTNHLASFWAPPLILYFSLQFFENLSRATHYDSINFVADISEMAIILVAFHLMGILDVGILSSATWIHPPWVLMAAFLIPPIGRIIRWSLAAGWPLSAFIGANLFYWFSISVATLALALGAMTVISIALYFAGKRRVEQAPTERAFVRSAFLSVMSIAAAALAGAYPHSQSSANIVLVLLTVYFVFFLRERDPSHPSLWDALARPGQAKAPDIFEHPRQP